LSLVLLLAVAGCGGGGNSSKAGPERTIHGNGFAFSTPAGWHVAQSPLGATAWPEKGSETTVSVTVFPLVRTYRTALWKRASGELDGVADRLAQQLHGTVTSRTTVQVGPAPARQYELAYDHGGTKLRQRITFALHGRREYELLCRWSEKDGEPSACGLLATSFRLPSS
jgi:hypothetical protein